MIVHSPVMKAEVMAALAPRSGGRYLDGTCGEGGHATAILEASSPGGRLIAVDRDEEILSVARRRLSAFGDRLALVHDDFRRALTGFAERGERFDGIVLDLGISSYHLAAPERGFSFQHSGPLDMRLDRKRPGVTAAVLVNGLAEGDLRRLIARYGEEREAGLIARAIVRARVDKSIDTTGELAELICRAVPRERWPRRIHPATRTFQAIRIVVNNELEELGEAIDAAMSLLDAGGRLAVLTFHSLEDRPVKTRLRKAAKACTCPEGLPVCVCGGEPAFRLAYRKAVRPSEEEVAANPRARGAKLRVIERLEERVDD